MEIYLCWFTHGKPYIPHEAMVDTMVRSTSNSSSMYGVVNDNSNSYRNMIMNTMRMN